MAVLEHKFNDILWSLGGGLRSITEPKEILKLLYVSCEELRDHVTAWPQPDTPDNLKASVDTVLGLVTPVLNTQVGGQFNDPDRRRVWMKLGELQGMSFVLDILTCIKERRKTLELEVEEIIKNVRSTRNVSRH